MITFILYNSFQVKNLFINVDFLKVKSKCIQLIIIFSFCYFNMNYLTYFYIYKIVKFFKSYIMLLLY